MAKDGKFNRNAKTKNKTFNYDTDKTKVKVFPHKHPVFCFKYLHADHNFEQCDTEEKKAFLEQIVRLSQMTWQEITLAPKHGLGSEKISRGSLNVKCPPFITEDVTYLLSLRFQGKKPFLVHRDDFICHVIFIDNKFSVYNH
jgi:hypothetical protein